MKKEKRYLIPTHLPQPPAISLPADDDAGHTIVPVTQKDKRSAPRVVRAAGTPASIAWDEFFYAYIRNAHTRIAYIHAVRRFLASLPPRVSLLEITPRMVGDYFNRFVGSSSTRKNHLSALRALFDLFVTRHIIVLNPARSVRGVRSQVIEGKTPEISIDQTRKLLGSIKTKKMSLDTETGVTSVPLPIGLRDRAIIATLIYTAARAGAVARLQLKHFVFDGTQWNLRFEERGGKYREIPARYDLQNYVLEYLDANHLGNAPPDSPLFRTTVHRTGRLTENGVTRVDICRIVKRRLKDAGLPGLFSPNSFRFTTITDLLAQGVPLEDVQYLAGHSDPRTTRLYDRRQKKITRNTVERISI